MDQFSRTTLLLNNDSIKKLKNSTIAIFGLGGVGSYVCESLARIGIGTLILIDNDIIDITNINRQIFALHSTIGQNKTTVAQKRILDINPNANIITHKIFYSKDSNQNIINSCDYVIDAMDSILSKISLIEECNKRKIPIISCMGTGNKLNPTLFEVTDIFKTSTCPICRILRHELKIRNINSLKVVYSKEKPIKPTTIDNRQILGSTPFVPAVAGLIIANEAIKDILDFTKH